MLGWDVRLSALFPPRAMRGVHIVPWRIMWNWDIGCVKWIYCEAGFWNTFRVQTNKNVSYSPDVDTSFGITYYWCTVMLYKARRHSWCITQFLLKPHHSEKAFAPIQISPIFFFYHMCIPEQSKHYRISLSLIVTGQWPAFWFDWDEIFKKA